MGGGKAVAAAVVAESVDRVEGLAVEAAMVVVEVPWLVEVLAGLVAQGWQLTGHAQRPCAPPLAAVRKQAHKKEPVLSTRTTDPPCVPARDSGSAQRRGRRC